MCFDMTGDNIFCSNPVKSDWCDSPQKTQCTLIGTRTPKFKAALIWFSIEDILARNCDDASKQQIHRIRAVVLIETFVKNNAVECVSWYGGIKRKKSSVSQTTFFSTFWMIERGVCITRRLLSQWPASCSNNSLRSCGRAGGGTWSESIAALSKFNTELQLKT